MDGSELLQTAHLSEAEHRAFSSSKRQVGILRPIRRLKTTYDAIASNPIAAKIYDALDVNLRTIIKVQGTAM